jgi:two-component system, sensor histidine kinase and response regulator
MTDANAGETPRALLVDDGAVERMVGEFTLKKLGYVPVMADSVAAALRAWETGPFALVLLDMHLPDGEGWELAAELRRRESGGPRVPVLMVSASAESADRERCLAAGADDYLTKPLNVAALTAGLGRLSRAA